jgi:hypothetical protein
VFHYLVTSQFGAWDSRVYEYPRERFCEFTPKHLKDRFLALDPEAIAELIRLPALFAYEGTEHDYRIGHLRRIHDAGARIRIEFEPAQDIPPIPYSQIDAARLSLDILDNWELSRTHWAIKDADLFGVLSRAGVQLRGGEATARQSKIPVAVFSATAKAMASRYSGPKLRAMFDAVGIEIPDGNPSKEELCAGALAWANRNLPNAIDVLADLITEMMTERPSGPEETATAEARQRQMAVALSATRLRYSNGAIVAASSPEASVLVIGERLGGGSYGEVFSATDIFGREIAVKFMHEDKADLELIMGHARALARADHPAIVTLFTVANAVHPTSGITMPVIAMELLRGEPLDQYLRAHELSDEIVRSWSLVLLDVLTALHDKRAFHGDLHPGNVLVTPRGLRVIDILYRQSLANLSTRSFEQHAEHDLRELRSIIGELLTHSASAPDRADIFRSKAPRQGLTLEMIRDALLHVVGPLAAPLPRQ